MLDIGEREKVYAFQVSAQRLGIPVFREVMRAVECIGMLLNRPLVNGPSGDSEEIPKGSIDIRLDILASGEGPLDEYVSKKVLAACGIPVVEEKRVSSLDEALKAASHFGFPLVAKGIVPGISHKTESNLVQLGIASEDGLESAIENPSTHHAGPGQPAYSETGKRKD